MHAIVAWLPADGAIGDAPQVGNPLEDCGDVDQLDSPLRQLLSRQPKQRGTIDLPAASAVTPAYMLRWLASRMRMRRGCVSEYEYEYECSNEV